jgi:oxygen-dependent protoporphyrinogen oxidase
MIVAVLGGGVTGLTAAWKLSEAGHSVRLLESGQRLGGPVRTERIDGWMVEAGPNSFRETTPEIGALLAQLGLGAERIEPAPGAGKRFVALGGALTALPSPGSLLQFIGTPFLSRGAKWRIAREIARHPLARPDDVSLGDFMREHFGNELVERAVQPFVSGVYAGDPERLSARHAFPWAWEAERTKGSLIRAGAASARARRALGLPGSAATVSFRRGMQALPDVLAGRLPAGSVVLNADAHSISPGAGSRWRVVWTQSGAERSEEFDRVVAALPAWSLARLAIGPERARPLAGLAAIEYPPVASVFLGFRRDQVQHPLDGFGALVPSTEKRSILGIVFSSSLFPGRAPEGHVALTVLAGGVLQPGIAALPADELVELVRTDLTRLLGAHGKPAFVRHTLWPRAIPQYNLGHGRHLEAMAQCERSHPGLLIGGNVRDGISIPDCLMSGVSLAKRALAEDTRFQH